MSISVILFKSKSCAACSQVEPIYKSIVELYSDKIKSETVDITENLDAAINNGVMTVPTVIFFKDGEEIKRLGGIISKEKLEETIKKIG